MQNQITQQQMQAAQARMLANSTAIECEECGSKLFKQVFAARKVSKIVAGTPEDIVMNVPMLRCDDCGTVFNNALEDLENDIEKMKNAGQQNQGDIKSTLKVTK